MYHMLTMHHAYTEVTIKFSVPKCLLPSSLKSPCVCISERLLFSCTFQNNTVIPRLTKIIRSGITFVSRNVISHRFYQASHFSLSRT